MFRLLFLASVVLYATGCSRFDQVTGDGLETGNAFSGMVIDETGNAVSGAQVKLYPSDYDPETGPELKDDWIDVTNSRGEYNLYSIPKGSYTIVASSSEGEFLGIMQDVGINPADSNIYREYRIPTVKLQKPANLTVLFDGLVKEPGGYLYFPGTQLSKYIGQSDVEANQLSWNRLPPGRFREIFYKNTSLPEVNILQNAINLEPAEASKVLSHGAWTYRQKIYINTTATGAGTSQSLLRQNLTLILDANNFDFSTARSQGEDIRLLNSKGDNLPFEISSWDNQSAFAQLDLVLDTLYPDLQNQYIEIIWGNPICNSYVVGSSLFASNSGFLGVYSFEQASYLDSAYSDRSGNSLNLYTLGASPMELVSAGIYGDGISLNGIDQALYTKQSYKNPNTFTLSSWIKTTTGNGGKIIGFGSEPTGLSQFYDRQIWMDSLGHIHFGVFPLAPANLSGEDSSYLAGTNIRRIVSYNNPLNDGKWHFVAAVLSSQGMELYVDGKMVASREDVSSGQNYTGYWRVGWDEMDTWEYIGENSYFEGQLDEIQISLEKREESWIKTQYVNYVNNESLFSFSNVEE